MLTTEPTLHRNNTTIQRELADNEGLGATKKSQNLRSTKLSDNLRHTKFRQAMLTESKPSPQIEKPPIQKIYSELHEYINTVDSKIQYLLQKQSNEYKVVYQHYYNKFRDQLYELKQKTVEQEKTFLQNDHVHYIENQLKICRQQASTYQHLYQKAKIQNDSLRATVQLLRRDTTMLNANAKQYLKEIKVFRQRLNDHNPQDDSSQNHNYSLKKQLKVHGFNKRSNSLSFQIPQQPQIKIALGQFSPKFNCLQSDLKLSPQTNILSALANEIKSQSIRSIQITQDKQKKPKQQEKLGFSIKVPRKQKQIFETQISQKASNNIKVFNICDWFLQCVQSAKRQILIRKSKYFNQALRISNQFRNFDSLEDFLNLDKLQVLKIFISKKQCIQIVYNMLKNQRSTSQSQDLYKISQYRNSTEIGKINQIKPDFRHSTFQSHESLNQTIFNQSDKLKFNKTNLKVNFIDKKKLLHRSLNEKQLFDRITNGTNGIQKTSNSLTKDGLNCIQESGEALSFNQNGEGSLKIADLIEKRSSKRINHIIKEKKNIRLSTHLMIRKKKLIAE